MTSQFVLVAYDGSESARVAMTWGMGTARALNLPVRLVTVTADRGGGADGAAVAEAERGVLAASHEARLETPGVPVQTLVVEGSLLPSLRQEAASAALVVLGSRGRTATSERSLGGTALRLVEQLDRPVVVVRSREYQPPGAEAGRVVVGVDGSAASTGAVAFAMEVAAAKGLGLTAVHALGGAVRRGGREGGSGAQPRGVGRGRAERGGGARRESGRVAGQAARPRPPAAPGPWPGWAGSDRRLSRCRSRRRRSTRPGRRSFAAARLGEPWARASGDVSRRCREPLTACDLTAALGTFAPAGPARRNRA